MNMIPQEWFEAARDRLNGRIRQTPLTYDEHLGIYLKWENRQQTGSFKLRGALNKVLSLAPWEIEAGIVAASAGNHGQGVALACQIAGAHALVFASEHAVPAKISAMCALGAEVRLVAGGYAEAEKAAIAYAKEKRATWISPYNDGLVIAGQGTLGLETLQQLPEAIEMTWLVPVSGGGLAAGVAAAVKQRAGTKTGRLLIIGIQSEASPFMHALYHYGHQDHVVETPTLADGLAGAVEANSITIPMVKHLLDDLILVSEEDIRRAIAFAWFNYGEVIEGSAAVGLAAILSDQVPSRPSLIIISGGNIQPEVHQEIIRSGKEAQG